MLIKIGDKNLKKSQILTGEIIRKSINIHTYTN